MKRQGRPSAYSRKESVGCLVPLILLFIFSLAFVAAGVSCKMMTAGSESKPVEQLTDPGNTSYSFEWSDDDYRGDYSEIAAASYILMQANGLAGDKGTIAGYLDNKVSSDDYALTTSQGLNWLIHATTKVAVPIQGSNILFLPAPSLIWIADGDTTKPVVFLYADEASITIADPDAGVTTKPFSVLSKQYGEAGRQAVYLANRGYTAASDAPKEES